MNLGEFSIKNKTVTLVLTAALFLGGIVAYNSLGRLEDPEFTIKEAVVFTQYPGATAREVEQEVTDRIETAVQQLSQLKRVRSLSKEGLSTVYVTIKDKFTSKDLPQIWDELRRKVNDVQSRLPQGVKTSIVNDDYGDVYGVFYAVTGDGYSYAELKDYVDTLRRELLLVRDVAKVSIIGEQPEAVYVEIPKARLADLGLSPQIIYQTLQQQNMVTTTGKVEVGPEYIRIDPTGALASVEEIGDLLLRGGGTQGTIYLKDVAEIKRAYVEPPSSLMRFNGKPALGIGISTVSGGNVVTMGEAVKARIDELEARAPVGMEVSVIALQSDTVQESIRNFIVNLIEALVIVIGVLLIFMGLRSGMMIGFSLLTTILATFIVMKIYHIDLQSISLGALIIALGMLVDNAIVVNEGILVKTETGMDRVKAAGQVVGASTMPLLGATVVGILAFAAIGLSPDSTGEYCRSLFQVVGISLLLSWLLAVTVVPVLCVIFLKSGADAGADPYQGRFYRAYTRFLKFGLRLRIPVVLFMAGLFIAAMVGFQFVDKTFFPPNLRPQFTIDYLAPQGSSIRTTSEDMARIEDFLNKQDDVDSYASFIGRGALRFILTYTPEDADDSYGQIIVTLKDPKKMPGFMAQCQEFINEGFPNSLGMVKMFARGSAGKSKIEVRFRGSDPTTLRHLAQQAEAFIKAEQEARFVRTNWRQRVKILRPLFSEARARQSGISRPDVTGAIEMAFNGRAIGLYREGDKLLPIIMRPPKPERVDINFVNDVQVWSQAANRWINLNQLVTGYRTVWEDPIVWRRNRLPTITVMADPVHENTNKVFQALQPEIESIPLPPGYEREWGGEHESSGDAQAGLMNMLPMTFLAMALVIIMLFNALRPPLIIILCLPMAMIGVTAGLLPTGKPFDFLAILGLLSLFGMMIKNAIVLLDQIGIDIRGGKDRYQAIIDSSVSRLRPVAMAAMTTVLGMVPLLFDSLFSSMAVTIMFGLTFATLLTLVVVPVLYSLFFRVKDPSRG